jgi:hypothetical protein
VGRARELLQQAVRGRGNVPGQRRERRGQGVRRGAEVGIAQGGGIHAALALHADEFPIGKGVQVTAGGVLEVAHEGDALVRPGQPCDGFAHGAHPHGLVVVVAHGQHGEACGILSGQGAAQHGLALCPGEGVLGRACLVGGADDGDGPLRARQRLAQQGHMAGVDGLEPADEDGGVVHASKKRAARACWISARG